MPKVKLAKRVVEAAKPGASDVILWDTELKGFGCKITPKRKRVYFVYYRTPDPLPINDIPGMARMWKDYYNTHLGKGTVEEFITNYNKYIGE